MTPARTSSTAATLSDALDVGDGRPQPRDREILDCASASRRARSRRWRRSAKQYGITRERVRQLELQAVSRLRHEQVRVRRCLNAVRDALTIGAAPASPC